MFFIYQKARLVLAWLGDSHEDLEHLLQLASQILLPTSAVQHAACAKVSPGIDQICYCLSDLYERPYFLRLWVQQEVFAARHNLILQSGKFKFRWSELLSNPALLGKSKMKRLMQGQPSNSDELIQHVKNKHTQLLYCFERFSRFDVTRRSSAIGYVTHFDEEKFPDFVDSLLHVRTLRATNELDYIYGILGMTHVYAKQMSINTWLTERMKKYWVIPIDYSADMSSLLCVVTWYLLMTTGLNILARFKVVEQGTPAADSRQLPSWAIDWRLTARHCKRVDLSKQFSAAKTRLHQQHEPADQEPIIRADKPWFSLYQDRTFCMRTPGAHVSFQWLNQRSRVDLNKFLIRGWRRPEYYINGNTIFERNNDTTNQARWRLRADIDADHNRRSASPSHTVLTQRTTSNHTRSTSAFAQARKRRLFRTRCHAR